ncbi:glutamate receptor ionotropic, delta-2 [Plakobranchus ocellatus]|uniref:Glutamate receptor ionotropic, delta-2 n=1 Tax=Plakobranchus ocellatus TaxID=259542 RepID=A0AAV3YUP1_9GAST|nr:glutamate receptor ionotropic, delta-2 [Plakobranchus ocellatus]
MSMTGYPLVFIALLVTLTAFETQVQAATAADKPNSTQQDVVKELRAVTLLDPPFVMMSPRGDKYQGFAVDILNEATKVIAFDSVSIKTHDDAKFGMEESPGKWNGLIGAVQNEREVSRGKTLGSWVSIGLEGSVKARDTDHGSVLG